MLYSIGGDRRTESVIASISSSGGSLMGLNIDGEQILFPWHELGAGKQRGGCFPAAPWFGASPRQPERKHGLLRGAEFRCVTDQPGLIELGWQDSTPGYPWPLRYTVGYQITAFKAVTMSLRLERGYDDGVDGKGPVNPGFHPYFACGDASQAKVVVDGEVHGGFGEISHKVRINDNKVVILTPEYNIAMKLGGDFGRFGPTCLVFWTDNPGRYFCLEPVLQDPDLFDTPQGIYLGQGEGVEITMTIQLL